MVSKHGSTALLIIFVVCIAIATLVGLLVHFHKPKPIEKFDRKAVTGDCHPDKGANEDKCKARRCEWRPSKEDGAPWCIFPADKAYGYTLAAGPQNTSLGYNMTLERRNDPSIYGDDLKTLLLEVEFHTESRLRIKIQDPGRTRFQIPEDAVKIDQPSRAPAQENRLYNVTFIRDPHFGVVVTRRSTGTVVFDTTVPGFTFSEQYIQVSTRLASSNVYGLGEHNHRRFRHDMNWKKWTIFTRDCAPVDEWNLYGAQPMYMNLEKDGNANALMLLNSNAMDVVLQPDPHPGVTFHVIGGILDFYVFLGPTPENVVQQFTHAVGRPVMPPYWSLGFQLSRWDYDNLTHVKTVVNRNRLAGIPYDVQYGDIDYMESKMDFTYDKVKYAGLPQFVDDLHAHGQRYIVIKDPQIFANETEANIRLKGPYKALVDGKQDNVFIKKPGGVPGSTDPNLQGECWPGAVLYPDFTLPKTTNWWRNQLEDFHKTTKIKYDALWIDMNEPSNFVQGSTDGCNKSSPLNYPKYLPNILGQKMYDKTICMDAPQYWGSHYDVHSLYGHSMSISSYNALRDLFPRTRPFVLTRSSFLGTGKYAVHWLGDNQSLWPQIAWSIVGMLEFSLFGFSYTGSDICGFWFATTEEMCQRWMQLGAFYPYARNHNGKGWPDQDPAAFSQEMIRVSRHILLTRYKLLPFLYTLMFEAHTEGSTVVRPLLHEFPLDKNTWGVDKQFLWGPAFMISPALEKGQTHVIAYFPQARWYNYYSGMELSSTGTNYNLSTPLDKINLHVRGGYILPWQDPANTTYYSRQNPMGLLVALGNGPSFAASGRLFWDDGESFETFESGDYTLVNFKSENNILDLTVAVNNYTGAASLTFDTIDIYGLSGQPSRVYMDGKRLDLIQVRYNYITKSARLFNLGLNITENHRIKWETI